MCWPLANECVSCPAREADYKLAANKNSLLFASASCHSLVAGHVNWTVPTTQHLRGPATISGPCPLVIADAITIANVTFVCLSGNVAISVVGPNVVVSNVDVVGASLLSAVAVKGVDISGLRVTRSTATEPVLAVLGHTEGDWDIECKIKSTVVAQPLSGTGTTNCTTIDLSALLSVFGRRYEVQFYNKDADVDVEAAYYVWLNRILLTMDVVLGVTPVLVHRQDLYLLVKPKQD